VPAGFRSYANSGKVFVPISGEGRAGARRACGRGPDGIVFGVRRLATGASGA
jgi:hypothetical protein